MSGFLEQDDLRQTNPKQQSADVLSRCGRLDNEQRRVGRKRRSKDQRGLRGISAPDDARAMTETGSMDSRQYGTQLIIWNESGD